MKKIIYLVYFFIIGYSSFGQSAYVDSLKISLKKTSNLRERFAILQKINEAFIIKGVGENKVDGNIAMIKIAQQLKNDSLIGYAYYSTGIFYIYNKCDFNTGLDYHFKCIQYTEKAKDTTTFVGALVDIGMAYSNLGNSSTQLQFIKQAERNLPNKKHPDYNYLYSQLQLCYADYYINMKQPKLALKYTFAASEAVTKFNNPLLAVFYQTYFGEIYHQKGDEELAEAYYKKAVATSDLVQFPYIKYLVKNSYVSFLLSLKKYSEAKMQAYSLLKLGKQTKNTFFKLKASGYLKEVFARQKELDSAYFYANQTLVLKDSVFNQENINKTQAMSFKEELRQQQLTAEKQKTEEDRKHNIQYALIALGMILFITLFLLLSRTVIVNEQLISFFAILGLLIIFEFINLLIHPWLASFTHESPLLMLMALVLIASLLIPLHHKLEHVIKEKLVEKNKEIRLAAAKKTIEKLEEKSET